MSDEDERDPLDKLDGPAQGGEPNASPSAYNKRLSRIEKADEEERAVWRNIMGDPIARRVIWSFLQDLHFEETRFACGPNGFPQSEATWFHAGMQEGGRLLHRRLERNCRELVWAMHDEHDPYFAVKRRREVKNG